MSRSIDTDRADSQPLSTTSARLVAVRLKSANKHIFRALLSLASANLLIRVMGLLNQIAVTAQFGQDARMDAYYVTSLIPTTLAPILASAMEASVIPVYARLRAKGTQEQASRLFSTLLNLLVLLCVLITAAMLIFKEPIIIALAPGVQINTHTFTLELGLAPFIFPILGLMTLNSFMEILLNTEGKFGWPAYAGLMVPLTTASCVLAGGKNFGVLALCIGTILGQLIQLGMIIYRAHKAHIVYRPILDLRMPELKPIMRAAWPALFGGIISMASPIVDTFFSSYQPVGTIAALTNALKLNGVPTGVLFGAVGRAALPYLASQAAIKDMKAFKGTLRLYIWIVGIATLLLTVVMTFGAWPIVSLIFKHGNFTAQDTNETAIILIGLSLGMFPTAVGYLLSRAFSALGKTHVLMGVSIFSVFANAIFDAFFGQLWGGFGIAFATSLYYVCTMLILTVILRITIGKLNVLTPPQELLQMLGKFNMGQLVAKLLRGPGLEQSTLVFGYSFRKRCLQLLAVVGIFIAGTISTVENATFTLRVALGSLLILAFLRYQYFLLLSWACINVFIGSSLPFFNGNNLLSGLTLPTLLLLFYVPTREAFKRMTTLPFWLIFFIWILLSIGISPIPLSQFMIDWTQYLDFVAVGVLTILIIDTRRKMSGFLDAMILPAIVIALYGIWGFTVHQNGVIDPTTGFFRISSIFGNTPPTLGIYLSILTPITIYRTLTLRSLFKICGGIAITLLLLTALGLTFNRGTLVALVIGLAITILFLPSRKVRSIGIGAGIALAGLVMLAATLANIPIFARFSNNDLASLNGRTYLWQAILSHYDPSHILGYGLHASDALLTNLRVGFNGGIIATAAHNIYLETMYEHGFVGLALLLLAIIVMGYNLLQKWFKGSYEQKLLLALAIGTFVSVFIQCFESNDIWNQAVGIYFFIFMALPFARYWDNTRQTASCTGDVKVQKEPVVEENMRINNNQLTHV